MKTENNKGFSLVELIVVIAIMAILVGVLAPAYLKYVEKSRKATDISGLDQVFDAAEAVAADIEYYVPAGAKFIMNANTGVITLSIDENSWPDCTTAGSEAEHYYNLAQTEWVSTSNKGEPIMMKAKEFKVGTGEVIGTVKTDGTINWQISLGDGVFTKMVAFSKDFGGNFQ